jgi:hypothetical protein
MSDRPNPGRPPAVLGESNAPYLSWHTVGKVHVEQNVVRPLTLYEHSQKLWTVALRSIPLGFGFVTFSFERQADGRHLKQGRLDCGGNGA